LLATSEELIRGGGIRVDYLGHAHPQGDADAMDRHVARMEELTGLRQRTKTWWVRGSLLGQGRLCMYALALGSSESPASALDRHELAH